jgi:hypothetical protein
MRTSTGSRHMRRKVMPIVAIAAAGAAAGGIAVLSGCGSTASAGSAPASIAGYIPASSPLYVQVSTDTAGTQWTNLNRLGTLFPGFGKMRAELDKALAREGIAWDAELKPLLGESAAIAITEVPETGSVLKGALTDPAGAVGRAAAKAADQPMMAVLQIASGKAADIKALITQPPGGMKETGTRDGATLYADAAMGTYAAVTEESLIVGSTEDVVAKALEVKAAGGEAALSGVFRFNEALSLLPDDVFAMGYVNVEEAGKAASEVLPQVGDLAGGQLTGAAAMSVTAQPDGLRMKAVLVDAPQAAQQTPYTPTLTAQAPADSIAYLGFNRLADTVQRAVTAASSAGSEDTKKQVDALTSQLPLLLGVNTDDLRNLTGGEHAVVVGASGKEPEAALALQVKSGAQATESLTALSRSVPVVLNQFSRSDVKVGKAAPFSESGVKGQVIPAGDMSVAWGVRGELAAIGNGAKAVVSVLAPRGAANSLAATPGFKAATQGMPAQVTGLAYVDVRKAVPVLAANGAFDGKDGAKKRANIAPLTQIAAWATAGETPTVEVYVGMGK